jgi:hypothetical protein
MNFGVGQNKMVIAFWEKIKKKGQDYIFRDLKTMPNSIQAFFGGDGGDGAFPAAG